MGSLSDYPEKVVEIEDYNIINLPIFSLWNAMTITAYMNLTLKYNAWFLFISVNQYLTKIDTKIIQNIKEDKSQLVGWINAIDKLRDRLDENFEQILPVTEGGIRPVTMNGIYIQELTEQLLELKPIQINKLDQDKKVEATDYNHVEDLINDIKGEVKKGNRVSFKLMQDLQATLENLSSFAEEKDKSEIKLAIQKYDSKVQRFIQIALQAVDSMDLIYQSAQKSNLSIWTSQIESIIQDFLNMLLEVGIEEIPVKSAFFDGETMISIGSVPPEEANQLEKFQVYSVLERGFKDKETGKIIREAKVITIY